MSILQRYLGGQAQAKQNAMAAMLPPQMGGAPGQAGGEVADLMGIASSTLGLNERDQNAAIQEYLKNGGVNLDPATTAWCAAFVNATLGKAGMKGTGSNMARSFMEWGQGVDEPQRGDLAVFTRGDPNGPYGHVGFFDGYNEDGTIRVLGGNQGDSVSYANYSPDALLGFRRGNPMSNYAGM
jgi:uncharacterized protein (TIGR02594 family)